MSTKRKRGYLSRPAVGKIVKLLEPLTAKGHRPNDIFADWLRLSKATLEALPGAFEATLTKQPYTEPPETTALFDEAKKKYKGSHWDNLCEAFTVLWGSTDTYQDTVGDIYMAWGWPNPHTAQYFTPYPIAKFKAMVLGVGELVEQRLKEAVFKDDSALSAMLAGSILGKPNEKEAWLIARVIVPALPYYEIVTVNEPACGSGVMLLAVADCVPGWATQMGLVQFYGQDIDPLCTLMCQTNILLYGLNGVRAK